MPRALGMLLLLIGSSAYCVAGVGPVPEIDPASGVAAIALVAGGLVVIRARRKP